MRAVSTFSPSVCYPQKVCVCGQNELEVCTNLAYPHISSFHTKPVSEHAHMQNLIPFEDSRLRGLELDIVCVK